MSASTNTPYIIGVIREKEKMLLEEDEYTRIRNAATSQEAHHALLDTAYGIHLAADNTPLRAVSTRLHEEFVWLADMLGRNHSIIAYITARYDALHTATSLMALRRGDEAAKNITAVGSINDELFTSTLWHDEGWEDISVHWREFLRSEKQRVQEDDWSAAAMVERVRSQMLLVMKATGDTPLMKTIIELTDKHSRQHDMLRPDNLPSVITEVEKMEDEEFLQALRPYRSEPVHEDAILAWWYALAIEAKTLRLMLFAKAGGLDAGRLMSLQRSLYRQWI